MDGATRPITPYMTSRRMQDSKPRPPALELPSEVWTSASHSQDDSEEKEEEQQPRRPLPSKLEPLYSQLSFRSQRSAAYDAEPPKQPTKVQVAPLPASMLMGSPHRDTPPRTSPFAPTAITSTVWMSISSRVRDVLLRLFDNVHSKNGKGTGANSAMSISDALLGRRPSIVHAFLSELQTSSGHASGQDEEDDRPDPRMLTGSELWEMYRIIDPTWKYKLRWDSFMCVLLLFLAFFTPFEVAFLNPRPVSVSFGINRFTDMVFVIDIYLNLHTACPRPGTKQMVYDSGDIARRYVRSSRFVTDVMSVIPFDLLMVLDQFGFSEATRSRIRVLRLCRLLRLVRIMGYVKAQISNVKLDYNVLNLIMLTLLLMIFSHWMACMWRLVPQLEHAEVDWLDYFGFESDDEHLYEVMQTYTVSLYWSVMTFTTIGYGDIVPFTNIERIFDIVAMLIGALVFGYIIGAVGNVVQQRSAKENEYYTTMQNLDDFMSEQRLPTDLQKEIRMYVQRLKLTYDVNTYQHYTSLLSPGLRSKLLVFTNHAWLTKVPHFKNTPRQFCVEIASQLTRHLFVPNETVIRYGSAATEIYFVTKGIAAGSNRLYTVGHLLGREALVRSGGKRQYTCHAITYLQCSKLLQEELFMILESYPQVKRRFRILAIKAIFREEIMAYCVAYRRVMAARFPEHHQTSDSTRMSDLFHKNDRTEHYKWKLEMLYPTTEQEAVNVRKVARMVTQWISVWRRRKAQRKADLLEERERRLRAMTPAQRALALEANSILPRGRWVRGQFVEDDSPDESPVRRQSYVLPGSVLAPPRAPGSPLQRASVLSSDTPQPVTVTQSGMVGFKRNSSLKGSSSEADGLYKLAENSERDPRIARQVSRVSSDSPSGLSSRSPSPGRRGSQTEPRRVQRGSTASIPSHAALKASGANNNELNLGMERRSSVTNLQNLDGGLGLSGQRAAAPGLGRQRDVAGGVGRASRRASGIGIALMPTPTRRNEGAQLVSGLRSALQQVMENQARISLWMAEHEATSQRCVEELRVVRDAVNSDRRARSQSMGSVASGEVEEELTKSPAAVGDDVVMTDHIPQDVRQVAERPLPATVITRTFAPKEDEPSVASTSAVPRTPRGATATSTAAAAVDKSQGERRAGGSSGDTRGNGATEAAVGASKTWADDAAVARQRVLSQSVEEGAAAGTTVETAAAEAVGAESTERTEDEAAAAAGDRLQEIDSEPSSDEEELFQPPLPQPPVARRPIDLSASAVGPMPVHVFHGASYTAHASTVVEAATVAPRALVLSASSQQGGGNAAAGTETEAGAKDDE